MKAMLAYRLRLSLSVVMVAGLIGLGAYGLAQAPGQATLPQPEVIRVNPGQNRFDPFDEQIIAQQPKVEKIAPKGIEDDDVPFPSSPTQAVVRVEEGKLIVRQRGYHYATVAVANASGRTVTAQQRKSGVQASTHDPADISVFDMKGNRLLPKAWKDKLKNDVHALVAFDGRLPNPRELGLFKDDTLIVVLPAQSGSVNYAESMVPHLTTPSPLDRPGGTTVYPPSAYSPSNPLTAPPVVVPSPGRPGLPPRPGTTTPRPPDDVSPIGN